MRAIEGAEGVGASTADPDASAPSAKQQKVGAPAPAAPMAAPPMLSAEASHELDSANVGPCMQDDDDDELDELPTGFDFDAVIAME